MPTHDRKLSQVELGRMPPEAYRGLRDRRVRMVLDDVRSRHNVGSIFRTSDAFGLEGLVLCGFTPCPPHREIEKTALGATRSVPWEHAEHAVLTVKQLQEQGYRVLAVEQTLHARPLQAYAPPDGPLAIVLGNEVHGVSQAVVEACDECLVIPQAGSKHSLNVSVCAGVVAWWLAGRTIGI